MKLQNVAVNLKASPLQMFFFYYLINCLITFKHFSADFLKALLKQILSQPARSLIVYQTRTLFLFFFSLAKDLVGLFKVRVSVLLGKLMHLRPRHLSSTPPRPVHFNSFVGDNSNNDNTTFLQAAARPVYIVRAPDPGKENFFPGRVY
jgi:hypothetical protein